MSIVQKAQERFPWFSQKGSLYADGGPRWAIIPSHRGKCNWDPIYGLLPNEIKERVLNLENNDQFGEIIFYKQIAFLQTDWSEFCMINRPNFLTWRGRRDEVWGDYYYAGYSLILREALQRGCGHIELGAPGNHFRKYEWENFCRACKNAQLSLDSDQILEISGIACEDPISVRANQIDLKPHDSNFFHEQSHDEDGLLHIRFRPAGFPL